MVVNSRVGLPLRLSSKGMVMSNTGRVCPGRRLMVPSERFLG